jgi:hypothetical protein
MVAGKPRIMPNVKRLCIGGETDRRLWAFISFLPWIKLVLAPGIS